MGAAVNRIPDDGFCPAGFCAAHAPVHMNAVAATNGFVPCRLDAGFAWADLSGGDGVAACVLAAAYPQGRFFAAGGAKARRLAEAAKLANLTWLPADLSHLAEDALPPLDFAVCDGGLARLPQAGRAAALARIATALKPGGMLLLGYHALPGFAAMMPLRDVLHSLTADRAASPRARVAAAFAWLDEAAAAGCGFLDAYSGIADRLRRLAAADVDVAATELFAPHLTPFHFAQMAGSLAGFGMTFAGNAAFALNMIDFALAPAQRPLLRHAGSRREFETLRDLLRNAAYRRDVYVRGAAVEDEARFAELHDDLLIGLPPAPVDPDVDFGGFSVAFTGFPFDDLRAALAQGPRRVRDLSGMPVELAREAVRAALAGGMVVPYAETAAPAPAASGDAVRILDPLNAAIADEAWTFADAVPFACRWTGSAVSVDRVDALVLGALAATGSGFAEAETRISAHLLGKRGGKAADAAHADALHAAVVQGLADLTPERLAVLARFGLIGG